ncbi:hypothetical protein C8Q75DRAFT_782186 [Abortiporus biennis]|nr:hypothetical protein C8Q75DRAFT_782186 [Abortiporus biennis]
MSRLPQILELAVCIFSPWAHRLRLSLQILTMCLTELPQSQVLITATSVIHTMFPIFRCQDRRAVFIFIQLPFKYEFYFSD